ncbi:MAG: class I SAM-dependent rRNA methyltransferase, partial [Bacteroidales bacterium]
MIKVVLKKGKDQSLKRFHPWVFSGAIDKIEKEPVEGEVVEVYSKEGEFLGCGHYQIGSITVRILSFAPCKIDADFWFKAIKGAYNARKALGLIDNCATNTYRLVHGEGDFLPGLIIDIYDTTAVLQAHSAGMFLAKGEIAAALVKVYGNKLTAVYDKSSATAPFKAGLELADGYIWRAAAESVSENSMVATDNTAKGGEIANGTGGAEGDVFGKVIGIQNGSCTVLENGNQFIVNWIEGQKTGFFLDQRDNRELVKHYSKGKNVLNLFCYTGGFSIYSLSGGATHVDSVDSSKKAMEMVDRNVELNGYTAQHTSFCEDAIEFMRNCPANQYDLMIVDPPAFAKHRGATDNALRAYKRLNALAIEKVTKGGIIFTYSCSQVVDKYDFALAVFSAAAQTGRKVRIL